MENMQNGASDNSHIMSTSESKFYESKQHIHIKN